MCVVPGQEGLEAASMAPKVSSTTRLVACAAASGNGRSLADKIA
jgi:hypothetical protein